MATLEERKAKVAARAEAQEVLEGLGLPRVIEASKLVEGIRLAQGKRFSTGSLGYHTGDKVEISGQEFQVTVMAIRTKNNAVSEGELDSGEATE